MNSPQREREFRDFAIAVACVVAAGVLGYSIYLDRTQRLSADAGAPLGTIRFASGDTARRHASRALWEEAIPGDAVFNGNSLRTGSRSETILELDDSTRIELDQNSLVVIVVEAGGDDHTVRLELERGGLQLSRPRTTSERRLTVGSRTRFAELPTGEARFTREVDGPLEIVPGLGSVTIWADDEERGQVFTGERAFFDRPGPAGRKLQKENLALQLLEPAQGQNIQSAGPQTDITFRWRGEAQTVSLELGGDPQFQPAPANEAHEVSGTSFSRPQLGAGLYYWRVRRDTTTSATGKFRVIAERALEILSPAPGSGSQPTEFQNHGIPATNGRVPTLFAWTGVPEARAYRLEIYADRAMTVPVHSQRVERAFLNIELRPGTYFFRVRSEDALPGLRFASPPHGLTISGDGATVAQTLTDSDNSAETTTADAVATNTENAAAGTVPADRTPALRLLQPAPASVIDMAALDALPFRWKSVHPTGARRFRLFALEAGGPRLVYEADVNGDGLRFTQLRKLREGAWAWSVRMGEIEQRSQFSITLSAQPDSPELVSDAPGGEVTP